MRARSGAIEVYSHERHAFDDIDEAVIGGLADQAAIAITNARLIEELERSQAAIERRADTERRSATSPPGSPRCASRRSSSTRVVEEAKRLLGTDGAHLTRMAEDGTYLVPVVVAGGADAESQSPGCWACEFPLGGGINGLAAAARASRSGRATTSSTTRIPHEPDDVEVAERLGSARHGGRAAPRAGRRGHRHARGLVGAHRVTSPPRSSTSSRASPTRPPSPSRTRPCSSGSAESEERYRFLVENSPDVVSSTDPEGRFTFLSEAMERMTGYPPDELVGQHFSMVGRARLDGPRGDRWEKLVADPTTGQAAELVLLGKDGRPDAGRGPLDRHAGCERRVRRDPRLDPRHQRAGAPRARAARVRGALSLPRRVVARPRLGDRREGHARRS